MPLRFIEQQMPIAAAAVAAQLQAQMQTADPKTADHLRDQLRTAEETYRKHQYVLRSQYEAVARDRAELESARLSGDTARINQLQTRLNDSLRLRQQRAVALAAAESEVRSRQSGLVDALGTAGAFTHLSAGRAIAMLPVRLETRYVAKDADSYELRVRIFPDAIHLDSHQRLIAAIENEDGQLYWQKRLADGPESESARIAWHNLCERHGEPRALWIAAALDPYRRGGRYEPGDGGPGAPSIPSVPIAPSGWVEPARVRALPDRWAIVGFRDQHRILLHWTKPVPRWLQATPELGEPGSELEGSADAHSLTSGIEWLTDFTVAEQLGMAARVPVSRTVARAMDRLLVFGVSAGRTELEAASEIESLLAAHAGNGLDFVPPGTATNNLDSKRTEVRSRNHDHAPSHQRLLTGFTNAPSDSHGHFLTSRLGVNAEVFQHATHNGKQIEPFVRALHQALWPATWGNLLTRQIEIGVAPATLDFVRTHFESHVRGLGLLPSFRVGMQPYGVLPVTSLDQWKTSERDTRGRILVNLLRSVRDYCRRAYGSIPYMPNNRDPQSEMMRALSLEPGSHIARAQTITPAPPSQSDPVAISMANWWQGALTVLSTGPINFGGVYGGARLVSRYDAASRTRFDTQKSLVSDQIDKSAPLSANYLAALAARPDSNVVRTHGITGAASRSVLYMLLRSAYLELADSAGDTAAFAARVATLQNLPVEMLEMLTTEVVDVCSYRVDAWVSSIANERLPAQGSIYLGGYGWSEWLEAPGEAIAADGTVHEDPASAGFIHMPSTDQAKTAAILYGGHLAHADQGSGATLALNLSSDRVRAARWLIEGQRQGQSLSALLGYRFERSLIESGLAQHIPAVRAAFPLSVGSITAEGTDLAKTNVVDGLKLHQHWDEGTLGSKLSPTLVTAISPHVSRLNDALDALSDLLVAEGVHQATSGNSTRAAAAFDALAEGDALQFDPEITATPAAGQQIAHRVLVVLPADGQPGWPGDENRPRAIAEPRLNAWAAALLGAPAKIRWRAAFKQGEKDEAEVRDYTMAQFDVCPLDLVHLAGERTGDAPLAELIRLRLMQEGLGPLTEPIREVVIHPERHERMTDTDMSLEEALGLAWAMKRVLTESRALTSEDLQFGESSPVDSNSEELETRVNVARDRVKAIYDAYQADSGLLNWWRATVLTGPVDPQLADARTALTSTLSRRIADATSTSKSARERVAALLGKEFKVLPKIANPNGAGLEAAFAGQNALIENDTTRPSRWLHDYGRVRKGCEALDLLVSLGQAVGRPAQLKVGQFPVLPGQVWIGERVPSSGSTPHLSMLAHSPLPVSLSQTLTGLVVDNWSEVVPNPRVITGVTFNYDEPKAQAPQVVLLAVAPDVTVNWDFQSLEAVLLEAFELAKLRGITAETLNEGTHPGIGIEFYRPALHLAGDQRPELEAVFAGA